MALDPSSPVTLWQLILANAVTSLPILVFLVRGVWYLSRLTYKVDRMWSWWEERYGPSLRSAQDNPIWDGKERRHAPRKR